MNKEMLVESLPKRFNFSVLHPVPDPVFG